MEVTNGAYYLSLFLYNKEYNWVLSALITSILLYKLFADQLFVNHLVK